MIWDNFSSTFELFAGISVAYASSETFSAGFGRIIGQNKFNRTNFDSEYYKFLLLRTRLNTLSLNEGFEMYRNQKKIFLGEYQKDPLQTKIIETTNTFKLLHFLSFLASASLLITIGYSSFYEDTYRINSEYKIFGLMIAPFISIWSFSILLLIKFRLNCTVKLYESYLFFKKTEIIHLSYSDFVVALIVYVLHQLVALVIIKFSSDNTECIFETHEQLFSKLLFVIIIISMILPFVIQRYTMKSVHKNFQLAASRYHSIVSSALIQQPNFGRIDIPN